MRGLARLIVALLATLFAPTTVGSGAVHAYDGPVVARVGANSIDNAGATPFQVSGVAEQPAWRLVTARGTPTTPTLTFVATNTADDFFQVSGHKTLRPTQDWINPSVVDDYAAQLRAGKPVSPIEVQRLPDGREFIMDGHHRYVASQRTGVPVPASVTAGPGPIGLSDWSTVVYGS